MIPNGKVANSWDVSNRREKPSPEKLFCSVQRLKVAVVAFEISPQVAIETLVVLWSYSNYDKITHQLRVTVFWDQCLWCFWHFFPLPHQGSSLGHLFGRSSVDSNHETLQSFFKLIATLAHPPRHLSLPKGRQVQLGRLAVLQSGEDDGGKGTPVPCNQPLRILQRWNTIYHGQILVQTQGWEEAWSASTTFL